MLTLNRLKICILIFCYYVLPLWIFVCLEYSTYITLILYLCEILLTRKSIYLELRTRFKILSMNHMIIDNDHESFCLHSHLITGLNGSQIT